MIVAHQLTPEGPSHGHKIDATNVNEAETLAKEGSGEKQKIAQME